MMDVNALIERLLLLINKRLKDQRVHAECDLAPDLPAVPGRSNEITQVLLNLMVNAIEAMPDGGRLQIQTRLIASEQHSLVIRISDTGRGIAPHLQQRIFEPFITTREGGTGLGLTISSQIVAHHGGTITLESQMGVGSTFSVTLPLTAPTRTEVST
jgi:two-component system NtrC family sensor kinase